MHCLSASRFFFCFFFYFRFHAGTYVVQIKLALRQLSSARNYSVPYCIVSRKVVVTCAIYCMQRAAIVACNNCRLSNVFENIQEDKVLQPMTAFGGIT